jgi:hypothetical protein
MTNIPMPALNFSKIVKFIARDSSERNRGPCGLAAAIS